MSTPKKRATKKPRPAHVQGDAVERAWRAQVERRKKSVGHRDLIRVKPSTLEGLEALMDEDGIDAKGTMVTNLVEAELKRRERRR